MERAHWQLDSGGKIVAWSKGAARLFELPTESAVGKPCSQVVKGTDAFGRPLCARCPVQREIRYGAYEARTLLISQNRRMSCHAVGGDTLQVELSFPEQQEGPSRLVASLSSAVKKLCREPRSLYQTLSLFLRELRQELGMEAAELFLADPQERFLALTAYDGMHHEAFMEKPWFAWGEGFPGLVAQGQRPLVTHQLQGDGRYLRQKVKKLGYQTYFCYPLELPQGLIGVLNLASRNPDVNDEQVTDQLQLIGPMLAAGLYTLLTRLSERGLFAVASALRRGAEGEGLEALLAETAMISGASCVRLSLAGGRSLSQGGGAIPSCPALAICPVWEGKVHGVKSGLEACPHVQAGLARHCLPLWSGGQVAGVEQLYFHRLPKPPSQPVVPALWQSRLGAELLQPVSTRSHTDAPQLEIHAFGAFQVRLQGGLLKAKAFKRRQALTLLKLLVAYRGKFLSSEELCERLWPGEDAQSTQGRLHVLVHSLRQVLEADPHKPQIILREDEGYRFAPQVPYFLDAERFEQLVRLADESNGLAALAAYRQALALYQGPFLADEAYADWAELERGYLQERAVGALFRFARLALELGQQQEAQEAYRRILALEPWREEAYRELARLLLASGRGLEAQNLLGSYRKRAEREGLPVARDLAKDTVPGGQLSISMVSLTLRSNSPDQRE